MEVTLQYFDDCPNWRQTDRHLQELVNEFPSCRWPGRVPDDRAAAHRTPPTALTHPIPVAPSSCAGRSPRTNDAASNHLAATSAIARDDDGDRLTAVPAELITTLDGDLFDVVGYLDRRAAGEELLGRMVVQELAAAGLVVVLVEDAPRVGVALGGVIRRGQPLAR